MSQLRVDIDGYYAGAVAALPTPLERVARELPYHLRLAPHRDVPWSQVFRHEITLAAPALVAEAMPTASEAQVREAVIAHMLSIIDAFGTDRIVDGQIEATTQLCDVLQALRTERDRAIVALDPHAPRAFEAAERRSRAAMAREHLLLSAAEPVSPTLYHAVSLGKQAPGFPASFALADAVRIEWRRRILLLHALAGVWLGLQFHDDTVDWEDDYARGGAWASALARGAGADVSGLDSGDIHTVRAEIFQSEALAQMLSLARTSFSEAEDAATGFGASGLARWAGGQARAVADLESGERRAPGYAHRKHKLASWASVVLP
jgi:hypothetical protein